MGHAHTRSGVFVLVPGKTLEEAPKRQALGSSGELLYQVDRSWSARHVLVVEIS